MSGPTPQAKLAGGAEVGGSLDPAVRGDLMLTDDSAEASLRAMWPLVFSREEAIREAVVDAVYNLYLKDGEGGSSTIAHRGEVCWSHAHKIVWPNPTNPSLSSLTPFDEPPYIISHTFHVTLCGT